MKFRLQSSTYTQKCVAHLVKTRMLKDMDTIVSLTECYASGSRRNPFTGKRCSSGTFLADELTSRQWLWKSEPSVEEISIYLCLLPLLHILGLNEPSVICILYQQLGLQGQCCRGTLKICVMALRGSPASGKQSTMGKFQPKQPKHSYSMTNDAQLQFWVCSLNYITASSTQTAHKSRFAPLNNNTFDLKELFKVLKDT